MIDLETYLLFVGASIVLVVVPGPDMAFLLGRSIAQGRKAGALAAIGINVGAYVHLLAAVLGLSAILMTSSLAFSMVKLAGAGYLVCLGFQAVVSKKALLALDQSAPERAGMGGIFWQGFLCDVLNPKVAIFYLAFLPQFIDPDGSNRILQLAFLGITLNVIAIIFNLALVHFSSAATATLRNNPRFVTWANKIMGAVFIALGIRLARERP